MEPQLVHRVTTPLILPEPLTGLTIFPHQGHPYPHPPRTLSLPDSSRPLGIESVFSTKRTMHYNPYLKGVHISTRVHLMGKDPHLGLALQQHRCLATMTLSL